MSEVGMVRSLIERVPSLGFRIRTVALDSGFYSVGAARYISRFKFILAVPVGDVGIRGEFDGRYRTRSKGPAADEQVDFRLIVSRRRAGLEPAVAGSNPASPTIQSEPRLELYTNMLIFGFQNTLGEFPPGA